MLTNKIPIKIQKIRYKTVVFQVLDINVSLYKTFTYLKKKKIKTDNK